MQQAEHPHYRNRRAELKRRSHIRERSAAKDALMNHAAEGFLNMEVPLRQKPRKKAPVLSFLSRLLPYVLILSGLTWLGLAALGIAPQFDETEEMVISIVAIITSSIGVLLLFVRNIAPNSLIANNRNLAKRFEALEDHSWEVRESEEIHRSLAEAFGDVVLHRTPDGNITFTNSHFRRYFGTKGEADISAIPKLALGNAFSDHGKSKADDRTILQSQDIELTTTDGIRWFSWTDLPYRDTQSGIVGIRSVGRDITLRKRHESELLKALDKAESANQTKSKFLTMVSHEIRTPLNGVIGMAKMLEDSTLDPAQHSYVNAIDESGQTLLALIEDLLDMARIEAGQMTLQVRPTNLLTLVEDVANILAPRAREKAVDIATFVDPSLRVNIDVDPDRLRQVLLNLAGNAVKFTRSGGIGIFVTHNKNGHIEFAVQDSGTGLTPDECQHIFKEFAQTSSGATRTHGGAGLGLSISQNLVSLMGGIIDVKSTPNNGSTFSFCIESATSLITTDKADHGPVDIFIADSPARRAIEKTLSSLGYTPNSINAIDTSCSHPIIIDRKLLSHETLPTERHVVLLGDVVQKPETELALPWLTWPIRLKTLDKVLQQAMPISVEKTHAPRKTSANSLKILVAEDNPINAMLVKALLKNLGHDVTHVENGEKAVAVWSDAKNDFDTILMDLHMPVMGGLDAIAEIRTRENKSKSVHTPIIVLSADGQNDAREKALVSGADDFLVKPLDLERVVELLDGKVSKQPVLV